MLAGLRSRGEPPAVLVRGQARFPEAPPGELGSEEVEDDGGSLGEFRVRREVVLHPGGLTAAQAAFHSVPSLFRPGLRLREDGPGGGRAGEFVGGVLA